MEYNRQRIKASNDVGQRSRGKMVLVEQGGTISDCFHHKMHQRERDESMTIVTYTLQGVGQWNEDAIVCEEGEGLFGVIDGATSLAPFRGPAGETGGLLAARVVAEACARNGGRIEQGEQDKRVEHSAQNEPSAHLGQDEPTPAQLLLHANERLRAAMAESGIDPDKPEALWSACAALVRIGPGAKWLDYAQLGDCMLAVYYADGRIRILTHDQLAIVDDRSKAVWLAGMAAGLTSAAELWPHVRAQIVAGRAFANREGGYGVLNGDPACADFMESGRISLSGVSSLLLFSDGLYIPKPAGESDKDGATEIAMRVKEIGLRQYFEWLSELEASDPECTRYPRMKKSDDKTAIWIDL